MEIKSSVYGQVGSDLAERLEDERVFSLVSDIGRDQHLAQQLSDDRSRFPLFPALGVIVVRRPKQFDTKLDTLILMGRAVVLFDYRDQELVPNPAAIFRLVNFLAMTRQRARGMDGTELVNLNLPDSVSTTTGDADPASTTPFKMD
jgi:hypothetical protein